MTKLEKSIQHLSDYKTIIEMTVDVKVDRLLGSVHPKHSDIIYPINYGYIQVVLGGDDEEQDVSILG